MPAGEQLTFTSDSAVALELPGFAELWKGTFPPHSFWITK